MSDLSLWRNEKRHAKDLINRQFALLKKALLKKQILLLLKVGFCGGLTTFSTFSIEALELLQNGKPCGAVVYMILSFSLCLAAVGIAQILVKS